MKDVFNKAIKAGDTIVYGMRDGSCYSKLAVYSVLQVGAGALQVVVYGPKPGKPRWIQGGEKACVVEP